MDEARGRKDTVAPEIAAYYARGLEQPRLATDVGLLELARTRDILERFLPPPPAVILDVGGGPGVHALWLAGRGYEVHLIDPVPLHVEQALRASRERPDRPIAGAALGDARRLDRGDRSADVVLLLGPLYHLTGRADRLRALSEARRVLRPGGWLFAAAISRFASALDGLRQGMLDDPEFARIVERDLDDGQHRNPGGDPAWFTTAYFHLPEDLRAEIEEAGFSAIVLIGVEGPGWLLQNFPDHWENEARRGRLLSLARALESRPSIVGASAHLLSIARRGE